MAMRMEAKRSLSGPLSHFCLDLLYTGPLSHITAFLHLPFNVFAISVLKLRFIGLAEFEAAGLQDVPAYVKFRVCKTVECLIWYVVQVNLSGFFGIW